jgi:hypothetical protein
MDQSLRRVFSLLFSLSVVVGCGDDPKTIVDEVKGDAAVDAGEEPEKPDEADAATGGKPSTGTPKSCDDLKCTEPATCKEADGKAACACPSGYDDTKGDGSECKDKDECASADDFECDSHATCENKPGSYECKCKAGYAGDGKSCKCADGYVEGEGTCLANDGGKCDDDLDCENGNCVSGICCASSCGTPDGICKTAEGATCKDGKTCEYPVSPDGEACDDGDACLSGSTCKTGACQTGTTPVDCNDGNSCTDDSCDSTFGCRNANNTSTCDDASACTTADRCLNGVCAGMSTVDCTAAADSCNSGVCNPADGSCGKKPIADGTLCDDTNTCTLMDQCSAGTCGGQGNACGINADSCTPGAPNVCACKTDFAPSNGECVPNNNECDANPCSPNAKCFDPSNTAGDVTCKCNAGYEGDGITCTATMPCAGNPCGEGRGTCNAGAAGTYTCACAAGFREVAGKCVCDLTGTFVTKQTFESSWSGETGIEDGSQTTFSWGIERHSYDAQGNLEVESISCGETQPELCGTGNVLVGREAYAQYIPANVYGKASMPVTHYEFAIPNALPGQAFSTPMTALLTGISLTDPMGAWPGARQNVAGTPDSGSNITNGARWIDSDDDQAVGISTYAVGPGGISASGDGPRPIISYGANSTVCPRNNPSAARLPFNWVPANEGLTVRRIKRIYSANRAISAIRATIDSCDAITGRVVGPNDNDQLKVDGVVGGCARVEGSGEAACSGALADFFAGPSQLAPPGEIVIRRAPDTVDCTGARAFQF